MNKPEDIASPETEAVLQRIGMRHRGRRRAITLVLLAALVGGGVWWWTARSVAPTAAPWETVAADLGDIEVHVVATGSLQARSEVAVGAETSGRVASVAVDVNDRVTRGQVLVHLDPETAANTLAEAQASLRSSNADLTRARASQAEAKNLVGRVESLARKGLVSAEEEHAQQTSVALAESDVVRASANVKLAKIRVDQAKTNLEKLVIVSPIDGIVMSRTVEPGSAISASLAAPELFKIAEDLGKMELHLPINEADVGRVRQGQAATFRVDAWPERTFEATVLEVSFAPVITNNVVTYTAVLEVDNADLALRPGMTATATIVSDTRVQTLRVPNAALRFSPPAKEAKAANPLAPQMPMRGGGGGRSNAAKPPGVWVLRDGTPTRVRVTLGPSDGSYTQVVAGELAEGDLVLIGGGASAAGGPGRR